MNIFRIVARVVALIETGRPKPGAAALLGDFLTWIIARILHGHCLSSVPLLPALYTMSMYREFVHSAVVLVLSVEPMRVYRP